MWRVGHTSVRERVGRKKIREFVVYGRSGLPAKESNRGGAGQTRKAEHNHRKPWATAE
jgi:hypothetical protein